MTEGGGRRRDRSSPPSVSTYFIEDGDCTWCAPYVRSTERCSGCVEASRSQRQDRCDVQHSSWQALKLASNKEIELVVVPRRLRQGQRANLKHCMPSAHHQGRSATVLRTTTPGHSVLMYSMLQKEAVQTYVPRISASVPQSQTASGRKRGMRPPAGHPRSGALQTATVAPCGRPKADLPKGN